MLLNKEQRRELADVELRHWWFQARMHIINNLLQRIVPPSKESLIVDIGCGTGGFIANISKNYRVIGTDTSEDSLSIAREYYPELKFIKGEFPDGVSIDMEKAEAFLLLDVLEHIEDDSGTIKKITSVMRTGSYLFIAVPADPSIWTSHDLISGHYRRYTQNTLELIWEKLPVETVFISYYNTRLYPVIKLIRKYFSKTGKTDGLANSDVKLQLKPVNSFLEWLFKGELKTLLEYYDGKRDKGYRFGTSLLAVLRKTN